MKKRWLMAALLALGFAFLLTGCVETDIIGKTYKVTFISEGAEYDSADAAFGSNVVFPETSPTKEDDETYTYTFEGWSLTEGEDADLVTSHVVIGDVTFYAVFSRAEIDGEDVYFSVSFKDGVTGEKLGEDQKVKEGEDATLPTPPEHDGYTFEKWDKVHTNITAKTVITALYTKNQYQLTRNFLDETKDESVEYDSALVLTAPEEVEAVFVFEGWYWDKNYDTPVETGEKMPAEKAEIFAKYSIDFSKAAITTDGDLVYGAGDDAAAVSGLKNTENNNIVYSFVWNDDSTAQNVELRNAGVYELSVTVTAVYGENVLTDTVKLSETVTVEKAVLDVTVALGADRVVYGTSSEPSVTYSGFQYEDSQTLDLRPNYTYTDKDGAPAAGNKLGVGTYTVGAEFAELGNYTIGNVSAATLTVTPKDLTVTVSAQSFAYGETHEVSLQFEGFANGDTKDSLGGEVVYKYTKNGAPYAPDGLFGAGAYTVAAEGFESENYTISYADAAAFTVSKRAATATLNATGGVYGTEPAYSVSFEGILSEDKGSFVPEYLFTKDGAAYQADGLFGAGTYKVTANFAANENYELKIISAEFTVAQAELNIGVKTTALVYGDAPTKFEITYEGFIEGEDESVLSGRAVFAYTKGGKEYTDARFVAGSYAVSVSGLTSENYLITFADAASFEVAKKDLTLTVTLQNTSLVYGERPVDTITAEGFVYKENMGDIGNPTVLYKDADGVDVKDSFHVGNYVGTVEAHSDNYNIIVEEKSFTVAKKDLTATVSLKESSLTYGVAPEASVEYEGFISDAEEEKLTANVVFTYSNGDGSKLAVGKYEVSLDGLVLSDYNVNIVTAQLSVTKKTLTIDVTADKLGYIYGETPKLALSFGEFAYGEDEKVLAGGSLSVSSNAVLYEDERFIVGDYTAKAVGFTSGNYDIEMGEVSFAVAPKEVTVTLSAQSAYTFGDAVDVTYSVSHLAFDETESVLGDMTIVYTKDGVAYTPAALFNAGEYSVTIENLANDNYTIKVVAATFTVNKQVFAVDCSDSKMSGTEWTFEPKFAEVSPFVFEGIVTLKTTKQGTYTANDESSFAQNFAWENGSYKIFYQDTDVTADFEISYKLTVKLIDSNFGDGVILEPSETTKTYDETAHEFAVTVEGVAAKVEYSINGGEYTENIPALTNAGTYSIHYRVSAENYNTKEESFEVTILKAQNEIDLTNVGAMEFTYDGTDHAVDFTKAISKNGDISVSGETAFKDAGEYVVTLSVAESENYLAVEKKVTVKVAKADYEIVAENQSYVYTGKAQGGKISVAAIGGDTYTVSYLTANVQTNVGSYTVEYTVSGNDNYNDAKDSYVLSITKAPNSIDVSSVKDTQWTYDTTEHDIDLSGVTAAFGKVTFGDHTFINAGTYKITLTVAGTENYDGATATIEVVVHKAELTVTVQDNNFTFNAEKQGNGVTVDALDKGYSIEYTYNNDKSNIVPQFIDAGSYTVTYRVYGDNYDEKSGSYTVVIAQKKLTVTNPGDQSKTYDGEEFGTGVTVAGKVDDQFTVTYYVNGELYSGIPAFVDAGEYKVTYTVSGKNYVTVNDSYTITIAKAQGAIDASKVLKEYTYNGSEQAVDLGAVVWTGDGKLSYTENKFTDVPKGGSFVITLTLSEGKNYFGETEEITITVHKAVYENVVPHPAISEGMGVDKKLSEVKLDANYRWADPTILLVSGEKQYDAYYNADPVNYEDFALQITVNGRREKVTIAVDPLEADFDATELPDYTLNYVLYDEDGERITEKALPSLNPVLKVTDTNAEYKIGSTYYVLFVVESYDAENQYYELTNLETETAFKLKSVGVGDKLYTIEDALATAKSGDTVIVKHDTAFASAETLAVLTDLYSAANYEVKAGVTLLVPYDASYSTNTKDKEKDWVAVGNTAYVTLKVTEDTKLTIFGKLIVNAKISTASSPTTSTPKGNYFGQMEVCSNALITFEENASFECMGFAFGDGNIVVKSGANMLELFNMVGYKGGTISNKIKDTVFPLNQYSLTSIICKTEVQFGAQYFARGFVTAYSFLHVNADVAFISTTSDAFMQLINGSIFKSINEKNGEITFDIHGDAALNNLTLKLSGFSMDTADMQVPIPGNFNIIISSGTSTISQGVQIKMLPGMELTVEKDAKLIVSGASEKASGGLSAYGENNYTFTDNPSTVWIDGLLETVKGYPCLNMPNVYRTKPVFEYNATTPAKVTVKGELEVLSSAYIGIAVYADNGAKFTIHEGAVLTASIKEDCTSSGAAYYTTDFTTIGNFNGEYSATFEAGKTYTYTANGWEIVA